VNRGHHGIERMVPIVQPVKRAGNALLTEHVAGAVGRFQKAVGHHQHSVARGGTNPLEIGIELIRRKDTQGKMPRWQCQEFSGGPDQPAIG